ncbi:MAG: DNA primase [Stenomitos frigidus ULC029]
MDIPRLHPDTIEQVRQRADIVDVVSEHVVLRKLGKDFTGLCPFHDDKTPSFTVSPSKQFYYCFSCGAGGNAIKFLMELGKHSFSEVVLDLAKRYQVSVQTLEPAQRQELQRQISVREQLHEILALTARFFEHALNQPQGKAALAYLTEQRKLSATTTQQFQLGYAPAGWETLFGYLVEQKHYPVALVERAGLIVPRKGAAGSYYDRFRDRLMIPIHDLQGRVVGFGGRSLGDEQPKYLNSPETELFDKGNILFALDKARAAIAKQDQAVVVEGYFDVIALHSAGITNVVASMGTALSLAQVRQLLRYTESKRIVFNFDADRAGTQAAERAIGEVAALAYQGEVQLRILNIPTGKDPDEFLQTNTPADYQQLLDDAPLWLDWQIQQAIAGQDLNQADQFQQSVQIVVKLLGNLPNSMLRTHYIQKCAELLSQGNSRLMRQLEDNLRLQVRGERWHGRSQKWQTSSERDLLEESEGQLLRLYLHKPLHRAAIVEALEARDLEFSLSHHRFLWRQILALKEEGLDVESDLSLDLMTLLQDRCTDFPSDMSKIYALFQLDETGDINVLRSALVIRAAVASMEKVMCEKRRRHFISLWEKTDCATAPELGHFYQKKICAEDQRIQDLDRERQTTFEDLVQAPVIS